MQDALFMDKASMHGLHNPHNLSLFSMKSETESRRRLEVNRRKLEYIAFTRTFASAKENEDLKHPHGLLGLPGAKVAVE
jgi:hypothetical protein